MAYTSIHKGIAFIEGDEPNARKIGIVEYQKEGFYNQQLKDLDVVKDQLAKKAAAMGCNAVINFTYGQKSTSWFRALLLTYDDNINWYGSGTAAIISKERFAQIAASKK